MIKIHYFCWNWYPFFPPPPNSRYVRIITEVMDPTGLVTLRQSVSNFTFASTICWETADSAVTANDYMTFLIQNVMKNWRNVEWAQTWLADCPPSSGTCMTSKMATPHQPKVEHLYYFFLNGVKSQPSEHSISSDLCYLEEGKFKI